MGVVLDGVGLCLAICSSRCTNTATSTAMAEVISCDVPSETLGFPPDDYSTFPVQLVPVLAMCSVCSGPADGSHEQSSA